MIAHWRDIPIFSIAIGTLVAGKGLKDGKLSMDGALAAFFVGILMLSTSLRVFGVTLLAFYFIGSRATRVGKKLKVKLEEGEGVGHGQRDAVQVFCNSLPAFIASLAWRARLTDSFFSPLFFGPITKIYDPNRTCSLSPDYDWSYVLILIALGQFGCSLGDTLASELGILSKSQPILITTLRPVPPGTNGAVSLLGTMVSILGGGLIGLTMATVIFIENSACRTLGYTPFAKLVVLGLVSGGLGSLLDSLMGATIQQTLYSKDTKRVLTNEVVVQTAKEVTVIAGRNWLSNNQLS
ncbi:hypothetical protein FS842_008871 [Serendipita sp. 407]|nr:hypothetical protein FS842_008871 [Serendipita sp. 407]